MKVNVAGVAVRHLCPYRREADTGTLDLTFDVIDGDDAPELHDLVAHVGSHMNADRVSHEDFTRSLLYVTGATRAVTRWNTAGCDVTVEVVRS